MRSVSDFSDIYLYRCPVDMRKFRNGLCAIVKEEMHMSVFGRSLFIFTNKRANIIRFLYWDDTGFAVWTKTLEKNRYRWPKTLFVENSLLITREEILLLLRGIDITSHKKLEYEKVF